jgi:hypothetical protein
MMMHGRAHDKYSKIHFSLRKYLGVTRQLFPKIQL